MVTLASPDELPGELLVRAYPQTLRAFDGHSLHWQDGTVTALVDADGVTSTGAALIEQCRVPYPLSRDFAFGSTPMADPGRSRCQSFFKKMYGATQAEVEANLVQIEWMPRHVGKMLRVSKVNGVDRQLQKVSDELDRLPFRFRKYLKRLGGTFNWRPIAGSEALSPHAFGIAIDINVRYGNYWRWDAEKNGQPSYVNRIPREIVDVFERHGFIWGGKWSRYDTMHFEYRPELLLAADPDFGKLAVLFLTRELSTYGAERQLSYLLDGLSNSRFKPVVVQSDACRCELSAAPEHMSRIVLRLRPWRKIANCLGRYLDAWQLLRLAREQRVQLIHCSYQWLLPYANFVGRAMGVPVVMHIRRPNTSLAKLQRLGIEQCAAVVGISRRIHRELSSVPELAERLHLIPDAVDLDYFSGETLPTVRSDLGLQNEVLFGLVGRVCRSKRQLDFVCAAQKLLNSRNDVRFVMAGRVDDGAYFAEVEAFIRAHRLEGKVVWLGHRTDVPEVLTSLDVLVSLAGGSVMYEAMALGRPVISAGFTQPQDSTHVIDQETGLVTQARDNDVLASMMESLAADAALRNRLGEAARARAEQHFPAVKLVEQTLQLYQDLLSPALRGD